MTKIKNSAISPMLAHEYDKKRVTFPLMAQPKLDGMRAIWHEGALWSRNGIEIVSVPMIVDELQKLDLDCSLDGELYSTTVSFQTLVGWCKRKTVEPQLSHQIAMNVNYVVYDKYDPNGVYTQQRRLAELSNIAEDKSINLMSVHKNRTSPHTQVQFLDYLCVHDKCDVDFFHKSCVEIGFEGAMFRVSDARYETKRSRSLLKLKQFDDAEFVISSMVEGEGKRSGTAGSLVIQVDGRTQLCGIAGGDEHCARILQAYRNNKLTGAVAHVRFFGRTDDNLLRFPVCVEVKGL